MLKHIKFIDNHGSFCVNRPENTSYLYFPLASEAGLKSSVTPVLGGDSKIDQDTFLLEPVSSENLHNNRSSRNFWIVKEGHIPYSVTGSSAQQEADRFTDRQEDSELTAGFMWQTLKRTSRELGLISTVTSFIPKSDNVEIMYMTIENQTDTVQKFTAYGAIPALISMIAVIVMSYGLTYNEAFILTVILIVGIGWSLVLVFQGLSTVHDYSFKETVVSLIITFVFMLIAAIVVLIVIIMWEQLSGFLITIGKEIIRNVTGK